MTRLTDERRKLVEDNLKLAYYWAHKHAPGDEDAQQVAVLGLMDAAASYDATKGSSFGTWVYWHVSGKVRGYLKTVAYRKRPGQTTENLLRSIPDAERGDDLDFDDMIHRLDARSRQWLTWRFRHGMNYTEIAQQSCVTRVRVRQVIYTALAKLRGQLCEAG